MDGDVLHCRPYAHASCENTQRFANSGHVKNNRQNFIRLERLQHQKFIHFSSSAILSMNLLKPPGVRDAYWPSHSSILFYTESATTAMVSCNMAMIALSRCHTACWSSRIVLQLKARSETHCQISSALLKSNSNSKAFGSSN